MPYVVDRQRALRTQEIVAIVRSQQPRIRSRVILKDNSLYRTLTRPKTFIRCAREHPGPIVRTRSSGRSSR
ncbi:MAG: hypothetical protein HYY59_03760 [Candidatus Omnitrophica bacterium]|nr:hypothetical protein [Candidatus Omnitrophota bacterium]MBI3021097.1 hypothetical protein [Candidatus Omnitrophota bacterium]